MLRQSGNDTPGHTLHRGMLQRVIKHARKSHSGQCSQENGRKQRKDDQLIQQRVAEPDCEHRPCVGREEARFRCQVVAVLAQKTDWLGVGMIRLTLPSGVQSPAQSP